MRCLFSLLYIQNIVEARPAMIIAKTAVRTPPTIAVSFFSFEQVLGGGAVVAAAAVGSLVALGVWSWRVALKVVVIWGASRLLQQLFV